MADGVRKDEEFSGTKPVEERHRIDEMRLDGWMRENVEGYQGPLTVLQFKGGQSNPTYRLDTPGRSYVMRRRPFGKLLPSAHAVDREFRSSPRSASRVFRSRRPMRCAPTTRDRRRRSTSCRWKRAGCSGIRRCRARRRRRGARSSPARSRRWRSCICSIRRRSGLAISASPAIISRARSIAGPSNIARPKPSTFPNSRSSPSGCRKPCRRRQRVSIVHGDYRLDNMIFHATEPRVQAVLDWELSTLGDPMADFTYLLMQWTMPGLANADLKALNIPSMDEAAQIYCNVTGSARARPELVFFLQSVPARRHHPGYRRPHSRRHRGQRQGHGVRQAHRAAVEGLLGIRAEGRREVTTA